MAPWSELRTGEYYADCQVKKKHQNADDKEEEEKCWTRSLEIMEEKMNVKLYK